MLENTSEAARVSPVAPEALRNSAKAWRTAREVLKRSSRVFMRSGGSTLRSLKRNASTPEMPSTSSTSESSPPRQSTW